MSRKKPGTIYGRFFGEFLLEKKIVTPGQLKEALALQRHTKRPLGFLAVDMGYLGADQLVELLQMQRDTTATLGELAMEKEYLTVKELDHLLSRQAESHIYLGEALVKMGVLTIGRLQSMLEAFHPDNELLADTIQRSFSTLPGGDSLRRIVEVIHRLFFRAINGHVKITRVEPNCYGMPPYVKAVRIVRSSMDASLFDYGFTMDRPFLLSLVYCLLQRSTWSERFIQESLRDFAGAIDYAVTKSLHNALLPPATIDIADTHSVPQSSSACVFMFSTIGEFTVFYAPAGDRV